MARNIQNRLNKVLQTLDEKNITQVAYKSFRKYTPYRSGNAFRNTQIQNGNTILADYPYAQRLEEGYSNQAPRGMSEPTYEDIRRYILRRLGVKI